MLLLHLNYAAFFSCEMIWPAKLTIFTPCIVWGANFGSIPLVRVQNPSPKLIGKRDSPQKSALIQGTLQKNMLPKESHERRYYQSFQSFSPFSDAETPENGETAGHLGLVVDSVAVPLPHMSREHWKFQLSSVLRIIPVRQELLLQDV